MRDNKSCEDCQDTSHEEEPTQGHPDHRRYGGYTRQKHKPLTKHKKKIIKLSKKRNRK